ncbi:uncharacterized protein PHACADRAFT_92042, partial [Phanerochaete carnosa HHB-10118-sp]
GDSHVLDDGGEAGPNLGNFERCRYDTVQRRANCVENTIQVSFILDLGYAGSHLVAASQIVPPVTNTFQGWVEHAANIIVGDSSEEVDLLIVELGGIVRRSHKPVPFVEAMQQLRLYVGHENVALIRMPLAPASHGGLKTKLLSRLRADLISYLTSLCAVLTFRTARFCDKRISPYLHQACRRCT